MIDPTNDFDPSDLKGGTSIEVVADLLAPARVVKAGNTFAATVLGSDPREAGGQRVIFVSGDDPDAKAEVAVLFRDAGFSRSTSARCAPAGSCSRIDLRSGPLVPAMSR